MQYFFGDDTLRAGERIAVLSASLGARTKTVTAQDIEHTSLEQIVDESRGSLFGPVMVVFYDPSSYDAPIRDRLLELVKTHANAPLVLWDRKQPDARMSFSKTIKAKIPSERFSQPKNEHEALEWISWYGEHVLKQKNILDSGAARQLVQLVGYDVWAIASEMQKLHAVSHSVSLKEVQRYVAQREGEAGSAFPLLDAIVRKREREAMAVLRGMLDEGASERFITAMLAYQFRLFLAVHVGKARGENVQEIHKKTGFHPVAIQKAFPGATALSLPKIHDCLARIFFAERSMNTTSMDARSLLTMLVLSLSS